MTNVNADSATDTAMAKPQFKMSRQEMQTEALIIESLLVAVQALAGTPNPSDALNLVDMAHDRARQLNRALDSVNCVGVPS